MKVWIASAPSPIQRPNQSLGKFVLLSGVILLVVWLAGTGRVAYVMVMLWIAAALGSAVLDLVDYEIRKKGRRG